MRASELKAGDWFETTTRSGKHRGLCVESCDECGDSLAYLRGYSYDIQRMQEEEVTPLPNCTGWDWQPEEPVSEEFKAIARGVMEKHSGLMARLAESEERDRQPEAVQVPSKNTLYKALLARSRQITQHGKESPIAEVPEPDTAPLMVTPDTVEVDPVKEYMQSSEYAELTQKAMPRRHPDACPTTGEVDCGMCSGEYCNTHHVSPCDCDVAERHLEPRRTSPAEPELGKPPSKDWFEEMAEREGGKCTSVGGLAVELGLYEKPAEPEPRSVETVQEQIACMLEELADEQHEKIRKPGAANATLYRYWQGSRNAYQLAAKMVRELPCGVRESEARS